MKKRLVALFIVAIFAILPILSIRSSAQDVNQLTLSVSPPLFELSANPGDSLDNQIRVSNLSGQPQKITVSKKNFTAQGEEGGVELTDETTNFSLASWIEMEQDTVTIPASEDHIFNFNIKVPVKAEPGGHFGTIIFRAETETKPDATGAVVTPEVGSLLLVKVAGDISEKASIEEFKAEPDFYENGPFQFVTRINNGGNVHFKPRGTISISNMLGQEVGTVNFDERNVLPDSIRRFENTWDPNGFRFGRYTATVSLVYGAEDKLITSTATFWVFPWKAAILIAVIIGLLIFGTWRYRTRLRAAYRALAGKS